jgi:hypothetical protein
MLSGRTDKCFGELMLEEFKSIDAIAVDSGKKRSVQALKFMDFLGHLDFCLDDLTEDNLKGHTKAIWAMLIDRGATEDQIVRLTNDSVFRIIKWPVPAKGFWAKRNANISHTAIDAIIVKDRELYKEELTKLLEDNYGKVLMDNPYDENAQDPKPQLEKLHMAGLTTDQVKVMNKEQIVTVISQFDPVEEEYSEPQSSVFDTILGVAAAAVGAYAAGSYGSRQGKQIVGVQSLGRNGSKIHFSDGSVWKRDRLYCG